jgi:hypothetical protein
MTSTLVDIAKDLVEVRRAFQVLGPEEQRKTFRTLQKHSDNLPTELNEEMRCIGCEVDYRECMTLLEKGLTLPTPVKYFRTSLVPNRRQSQAYSRSSMLVMSMADSGASSLPMEEEELVPNNEIFSSHLLQDGLDIAQRLQQSYHADSLTDSSPATLSLSPYLISLIDTATLIVKLRSSVLNEDWILGKALLEEIEALKGAATTGAAGGTAAGGGGGDTMSMIKAEIQEATQVIHNSLLVSFCESSLQSHQSLPSSVDIGFLDLSQTSMGQIDEAIRLCEETNHKSKRAEILYSALLVMKDLRRSVLSGDWSAVKIILTQIKQQGISSLMAKSTVTRGTFPLCGIEIESVRIAAINQEALKSLRTALMDELVQGMPGSIDVEKIETYKLTASLGTVMSVPVHDRGEFLSNFYNLSDLILKGRKSIQSMQWNVLRSFSTMWKDKLTQMKLKSLEIFEELNSGIYGHSHSESQSHRESHSERDSQSHREREREGPERSLNIKAISLQFPLKDFEYLFDELLNERDLLENHVTMIQLEGEVSKALLENGVSSDMVGSIDLSKIRIDGLQLVLQRKDNLLLATKSILPNPVEKLCKAAHLMLDIRTAILKGHWEKVPGLLEEALTGPYHPLPQACQQEINVIRLECENRWIINSLTGAVECNGLLGTVDDFKDTSEVNTEQLKDAINACYTLTPRTDEAIRLLRTAEDLLKLRTLLTVEEPDWFHVREVATEFLENEHLHQIGVPELQLAWIIADNILLCRMMEEELIKNGTSGKPGSLDLSQVDTRGLAAACRYAMETSVRSKKANQLLYACRSVLALREALLRAVTSPETASDALNTVKSIVFSMYEVHTKNPRDAGWILCRNEVSHVLSASLSTAPSPH